MSVAVAVDPAMTTGAYGAVVSPTFNAPDSSVIVVAASGFFLDQISNTQGALTWVVAAERTAIGNRDVRIWTAEVASAKTGMSVTVQNGGDTVGGVKVWVCSGADSGAPVGKTANNASTDNNLTVNAYTATRAGSLGFAVGFEDSLASDGGLLPTSTDIEVAYSLNDIYGVNGAGIFLRKAAVADAAAEQITFNMDAQGAAAANWIWAAVEIVPPDGPTGEGGSTVVVLTTVESPGAGTPDIVPGAGTTTPASSAINVAGAGSTAISAGSTATSTVVSTGGGAIGYSGGSSTTTTVTASAGGIPAIATGTTGVVDVVSTGGGMSSDPNGGSTATMTATASGDGAVTSSGGGQATTTVTASGAGTLGYSGGSQTAITITAPAAEGAPGPTGGSTVTMEVLTGAAVAIVTVETSGGGAPLVAGGSPSPVAVAASGAGTWAISRGATVTSTISVSGTGLTKIPGGAKATMTAVPRGGGLRSRVDVNVLVGATRRGIEVGVTRIDRGE